MTRREALLLLSQKGQAHFIFTIFVFREKRVKFVELLTSVGAKTSSTPCPLPIIEIKSDPLFRLRRQILFEQTLYNQMVSGTPHHGASPHCQQGRMVLFTPQWLPPQMACNPKCSKPSSLIHLNMDQDLGLHLHFSRFLRSLSYPRGARQP